MKKIIAFTNGDSNKAGTWSNVPWYFLRTVEKQNPGIEIVRVNLKLESKNRFLFTLVRIINKILRMCGAGFYEVCRMGWYRKAVRKKMLKTLLENPDAELLVSFDFDSSIADQTEVTTLLFCDWTVEYGARSLRNREPNFLEEKAIALQNKTIRQADYVVTIFPNVYDYMKGQFDNVYYLGNVINADKEAVDMLSDEGRVISERRYRKRKLLFIGKPAYKSAAESLIKAAWEYNKSYKDGYTVDIIGIDDGVINLDGEQKNFVTFYGYLNKDNPEQSKLYYELIDQSMFAVNTEEQWFGASSIIECMYFGLPVIVTPNKDIIKTFGDDLKGGFYSEGNKESQVLDKLFAAGDLALEQYRSMGASAQEAVKEFSWDGYMSRLCELVTR